MYDELCRDSPCWGQAGRKAELSQSRIHFAPAADCISHTSAAGAVMMLRMAGWVGSRPSLLLLGRQTENELMEPGTAISLPQFLWKLGCYHNGRLLLCRCSESHSQLRLHLVIVALSSPISDVPGVLELVTHCFRQEKIKNKVTFRWPLLNDKLVTIKYSSHKLNNNMWK